MICDLQKPIVLLFLVLAQLPAQSMERNRYPDSYFPQDESGWKGVSGFQDKWYSAHLRKMQELPLNESNSESPVFRLTIIPSIGDSRSVRLYKDVEGYNITFKRLDNGAGDEPGMLVEETSSSISDVKVRRFLTIFNGLGFFDSKSKDDNRGLGGSEWILEAVVNGEYHVIVRWLPTYEEGKRRTGRFVEVCEWLLRNAPGAET